MDELDDSKKDLFISEEDYIFFQSLPNDEQILLLFDLWCSEGVVEVQSDSSIESMIDMSIQSEDAANVLISDDLLIVNSNDTKTLTEAISNMFRIGLVLERLFISEAGLITYKRQKYCRVYSIIGPGQPIIYN